MLLSPLGARLHLALRLAIESRLRQRLGYHPQCLHHNDGILVRLTDTDEPVLDLLAGITADNLEDLILDELADSALFALRFRQNAARALLMPRGTQGKRAPLWLQRLRGRDLLQVARKHPDFPVVVETFRECLHDHLDVPSLKELLGRSVMGLCRSSPGGRSHRRRLPAACCSPSRPVRCTSTTASNPMAAPAGALDQQLLEQLVAPEKHGHLLDPRAVHQVERRLRGLGQPPRWSTRWPNGCAGWAT